MMTDRFQIESIYQRENLIIMLKYIIIYFSVLIGANSCNKEKPSILLTERNIIEFKIDDQKVVITSLLSASIIENKNESDILLVLFEKDLIKINSLIEKTETQDLELTINNKLNYKLKFLELKFTNKMSFNTSEDAKIIKIELEKFTEVFNYVNQTTKEKGEEDSMQDVMDSIFK